MSIGPETFTSSAHVPRPWLDEDRTEEPLRAVEPRKISIFGLGYVGAVSLACLARDGHSLIGVDIDSNKLELLRRGQAPIVETGIQELMRTVSASGRVRVTDNRKSRRLN